MFAAANLNDPTGDGERQRPGDPAEEGVRVNTKGPVILFIGIPEASKVSTTS